MNGGSCNDKGSELIPMLYSAGALLRGTSRTARLRVCPNLANIISRDVRRVLCAARVTFPAVTDSTTLGCACRMGSSGALSAPEEAFAFPEGGKHAVP